MSKNKLALNLLKSGHIIKSLCHNKYNVLLTTQKKIHFSREKNIRLNESCMLAKKAIVNQKSDWNKVVSEAEKVVDYPSFLDLRRLFSDETVNMVEKLRKLVEFNHLSIQTAKNLIYNGHNNDQRQAWGLIVLLISKAAGHLNIDDMEKDKVVGVLHSQRVLADITEMIRASYLMHKGLVNIAPGVHPETSEFHDMTLGNKIALLCGDYLISKIFIELANLKNQDVLELMSTCVKNIAEAEFVGRRDNQNNPLPCIPPSNRKDYAVKEWSLRNVLSVGYLLGRSCKSTLKLAGHSDEIQKQGYKFGDNLALAWQANLDLRIFTGKKSAESFNLCSAPVLFHIEHDSSILTEINKGLESVDNIDYREIYSIVSQGPGIKLTEQLLKQHSQKATEVLNVFQENDAREALYNIIVAIEDF